MKKRYFESKRKELQGTPYDSCTERDLHNGLLKEARHHVKEDQIEYVIPHKYEPDFVLTKDGKKYIIEVKGRFRDSTESAKYKWIRDVLPEDSELVFIWDQPNKTYPFAKTRKDGTKLTHEEWADKNEFRHWNKETFHVDKL